jgi:hypothetical protein
MLQGKKKLIEIKERKKKKKKIKKGGKVTCLQSWYGNFKI